MTLCDRNQNSCIWKSKENAKLEKRYSVIEIKIYVYEKVKNMEYCKSQNHEFKRE